PHHLILRGNNRQAVFFSDLDRQQFLAVTAEAAGEYKVSVHAYVLMDNQLHLLVTPPSAEALSRMMQSLGRRYVGWFNARHQRTGTLWEGRFRACLIEGERHLLACMRYIEMTPVGAGLCAAPEQWPWSSAAHHLGLARTPLITEHGCFWRLGNTPFEREHVYREFLSQGVPPLEHKLYSEACLRGRPVASEAFLQQLSEQHAPVVSKRPRGRPRKIAA
ncbi:MAG: transposase, partial [Proteobacteria bacterium]